MFLKKNTNNLRSLFTVFAVFALAVTVLWLGANNSTAYAGDKTGDDSNSPAATFTGTGLGAIPDGSAAGYGAPLNVTFAVTGVTGNVTDVSVSFAISHTWLGDVDAVLTSPGGTRTLVIFSRIGSTTAGGVGDSSDFGGTYTFTDTATANIWTVATAAAATAVVAPGSYRTTGAGGAGQTNPAPFTSLNATFSGLTPAQANGTWTLAFRDGATDDVGSVTAATLTVNPTGPTVVSRKILDFTGDGRSDWATASAASATAPIVWKVTGNPAPAGPNASFIRRFDYGIGSDTPLTEDYRGDAKNDVSVWRSSEGRFYVAQFPTGTGGIVLDTAVTFGAAGDRLTAQGDYDGDGKADYTVVRSAGGVLTWYVMGSATNTMRAIQFGSVGTASFTVFAGADFNADGRDEFVLLAVEAGTSNNIYYIGDSNTGAGVLTRQWGNFNTDYAFAPDDFTGDNRADLVSIRQTPTTTPAVWYILNTADNTSTATAFGQPGFNTATSDDPVRGDYDGDGRSDIAVYRQSNATFYYIRSSNGQLDGQQSGDVNDIALGNFGSVF